MPKVVAIVQARMGSTRLPGKVLMDIGGKPALQWVVDAADMAEMVDHVIVATPDPDIIEYCEGQNIAWIMGPEDNVLERFQIASDHTRASKIVRLTADCPFVDPDVIDQCVKYNSCAVDEWPDGMDVQVIDPRWLPMGDREHVVPVRNNLPQLKCPLGNLRHIRVTLDTAEDLARCRAIAKHVGERPNWQDVVIASWEPA